MFARLIPAAGLASFDDVRCAGGLHDRDLFPGRRKYFAGDFWRVVTAAAGLNMFPLGRRLGGSEYYAPMLRGTSVVVKAEERSKGERRWFLAFVLFTAFKAGHQRDVGPRADLAVPAGL